MPRVDPSVKTLELPGDAGFVRHLLQRFAFGPRPGEVARIRASGAGAWLDAQLAPASIADAAGDAALKPFRSALAEPADLFEEIAAAVDDGDEGDGKKDRQRGKRMLLREMGGTIQMTALARHIASERQVLEVMVDFWTNHFNVFARKGPTGFVTADFVERAIRPNALGSFEALLAATARHPAMLIYLDNWRSFTGKINENYGRELLELHTLGVNGGYTQADVVDVSRILTGWSVQAPGKGSFGFLFRAKKHDTGEKTVLGERYASAGEAEGRALIAALAVHPSTARHLAAKLCQRFVADEPPVALVARVAETWRATGGDIAACLRAIAVSAEFAAPETRGAKIKSPLRFVASAARALGAVPDGTDGLAKVVARLGQPLFLDPVPTGYPEFSRAWLNASALLDRMNIASAIAAEKIAGLAFDADALFPDGADVATRVNDAVLGGEARPQTIAALRAHAGALKNPALARPLALAMALGSPDFQRS